MIGKKKWWFVAVLTVWAVWALCTQEEMAPRDVDPELLYDVFWIEAPNDQFDTLYDDVFSVVLGGFEFGG